MAFFDGPLPERTLFRIRLSHRLDDRQGQFPFPEIVTDVLPGRARVATIVQKIVWIKLVEM